MNPYHHQHDWVDDELGFSDAEAATMRISRRVTVHEIGLRATGQGGVGRGNREGSGGQGGVRWHGAKTERGGVGLGWTKWGGVSRGAVGWMWWRWGGVG